MTESQKSVLLSAAEHLRDMSACLLLVSCGAGGTQAKQFDRRMRELATKLESMAKGGDRVKKGKGKTGKGKKC